MSKITNDGLIRSGTGCYIAVHMATLGVKGLNMTRKLCARIRRSTIIKAIITTYDEFTPNLNAHG